MFWKRIQYVYKYTKEQIKFKLMTDAYIVAGRKRLFLAVQIDSVAGNASYETQIYLLFVKK